MPRLDIDPRWRYNDLQAIVGIPYWDFCVIPPTSADRPIYGDIVHPIKKKLSISRRMEFNLIDQLPHPPLDVCLSDVPFLQQNDLDRILPSLTDRHFLFLVDDLENSIVIP